MNIQLDRLIRRIGREPQLLSSAKADPSELAAEAGVTREEVELILRGDLASLYKRNVHPLLLMQLASDLRVDPFVRLKG